MLNWFKKPPIRIISRDDIATYDIHINVYNEKGEKVKIKEPRMRFTGKGLNRICLYVEINETSKWHKPKPQEIILEEISVL